MQIKNHSYTNDTLCETTTAPKTFAYPRNTQETKQALFFSIMNTAGETIKFRCCANTSDNKNLTILLTSVHMVFRDLNLNIN